VTIGGREIVVEIDGDRILVEGRDRRAHLSPVPGTPLRHLLLDQESLTLAMERRQPGEWSVGHSGVRHDVRVVDERTRHIEGLTGRGQSRGGPGTLNAPMPGMVVRVLAAAGQVVEAGQGLVVLEAMKMENELRAPAAGVVQSVAVTAGQTVEKGQLLMEFGAGLPPLT
jgi:pyruvate carboxylase subunit B